MLRVLLVLQTNLRQIQCKHKKRFRVKFMVKGKRQFLARDQVFLLLIVFCSLCLHRNQYIYARVMHKNCLSLYLLIF